MRLFRTLLWRESRDHRVLLLSLLVLGPVVLALLQVPLSAGLIETLPARIFLPGLVLLSSTVLGADLFCREAESGVAHSFSRLPIPAHTAYLAKLTLFISASIGLDLWLLSVESLRLLVGGGDLPLFLGACGESAASHLIALFVGLGTFVLATLIRRSLSGALAALALIVGLPYLVFETAPTHLLVNAAGPASGLSLGVWLLVVAVALVLAGYSAWRVRSGNRLMALRRVGSFAAIGFVALGLAGSASAGHWWLTGRAHQLHEPILQTAACSPDGRWLAVPVMAERPRLGRVLGLWNASSQARGASDSRLAPYTVDMWIYELKSGDRVAVLRGYQEARWRTGGTLEVSRTLNEGEVVETANWDPISAEFLGDSIVEPKLPREHSFVLRRDLSDANELCISDPSGVKELKLTGLRSDASSWFDRSSGTSGVTYVSGEGDLVALDLTQGLPGVARTVATELGEGEFFVHVRSETGEALVQSRLGGPNRFINLETGACDVGPGPGYHFVGWSHSAAGSVQPVHLFRSSKDSSSGKLYFQGPAAMEAITAGLRPRLTSLAGEGFVLQSSDAETGPSKLRLLDKHGQEQLILGSFGLVL